MHTAQRNRRRRRLSVAPSVLFALSMLLRSLASGRDEEIRKRLRLRQEERLAGVDAHYDKHDRLLKEVRRPQHGLQASPQHGLCRSAAEVD